MLPGQAWTRIATVDSVPGQDRYSVIDSSPLTNGAQYTYLTVALYADTQSDPSNLVTIVAVNDPPSASDDSYSVAEDGILNQSAPGVLANDSDAESTGPLTALLATGAAHGTVVLNADGSFIYTPVANYNGPDTSPTRPATGSFRAHRPQSALLCRR